MPTTDTNLQTALVWVGTEAQIATAIQNGDIGQNDFSLTTDSPDYLVRSDIVSSVSSLSDNTKAVGAKLFYDTCGDIETLINAL